MWTEGDKLLGEVVLREPGLRKVLSRAPWGKHTWTLSPPVGWLILILVLGQVTQITSLYNMLVQTGLEPPHAQLSFHFFCPFLLTLPKLVIGVLNILLMCVYWNWSVPLIQQTISTKCKGIDQNVQKKTFSYWVMLYITKVHTQFLCLNQQKGNCVQFISDQYILKGSENTL